MYRAKVEKVVGSKVYADGKWLQCIGNKIFRVGDYVDTDGRCAYGRFKESQQPLIIPPQDEAIPIIFETKENFAFYTFRNGHLKFIDEIEKEVKEYTTMINDAKGHVFVYTPTKDDANALYSANIDRYSNTYEMIVQRKDSDGAFSYPSVTIRKNGIFVNKINLNTSSLIADLINDVITPKYNTSTYSEGGRAEISNTFIEDVNNWSLLLHINAVKTGTYYGISKETTENSKEIFFLVNQNGIKQVANATATEWSKEDNKSFGYYFKPISWQTDSSAKIPLRDNYFFKMKAYNDSSLRPGLVFKTFFTDKNKEIFTILISIVGAAIITKTKSGYLFYSDVIFWTGSSHLDNYYDAGLYLFKENIFHYISPHEPKPSVAISDILINDRFRVMKKCRGWQNNIQEISPERD